MRYCYMFSVDKRNKRNSRFAIECIQCKKKIYKSQTQATYGIPVIAIHDMIFHRSLSWFKQSNFYFIHIKPNLVCKSKHNIFDCLLFNKLRIKVKNILKLPIFDSEYETT